jgi:uncharacterized protein
VTIVIAGGSGFLGRKLARRLKADGHRIVTLTRRPTGDSGQVAWQPDGEPGTLPRHLEGTDAVVNLAGEGIADKRWSPARKEQLRSSRVLSTRTLVRAVTLCSHPPRVFVSGSGKDYYGPRDAAPVSEAAGPGSDFLARLCVEWEQEARIVESPATRLAIVRTGLALDRDGGALAKMLLPFKLGLGATLASGDQFMSWIHVDDWTAMVSWLIRDDRATGAFNATAPAPVTNRAFTRTLGRVLHRPAVLHAPGFVLRAALGELAMALIGGQAAVPAHAEQLGFRFTHRALEPALASLNL